MELAVLALACWRLSSLLSSEEGPWGVFTELRRLVGVTYDEEGTPHGSNTLAKGIICPWCNSVWIGLALAGLYYLWGNSWWLSLPFALSAVACVLTEKV